MALTNRERIDKGLALFRKGAVPFVERNLKARLGPKNWQGMLSRASDFEIPKKKGEVQWDSQLLLNAIWTFWNDVFRHYMSQTDRSMVSELRKVRNDYAHEKPFSYDDTDRALDSIRRLLHSCGSAAEAKEVGELRKDLIRVQFREEARKETRKAVAVEGDPTAGLKAWREVVTPHEDVASGRYQQAEFAADLAEVQRGEGSSEYSDPREFYSRTFITDGLKDLLTGALTRLTGQGGDPVVELKTNFGGGKTHSMLALYHLVSGESAEKLPGIDEIARKLEVTTIPKVNRAVLVGYRPWPGPEAHKAGRHRNRHALGRDGVATRRRGGLQAH